MADKLGIIRMSAVKDMVHGADMLMTKEAEAELERVVERIIHAAVDHTRPGKKIFAKEILYAAGAVGRNITNPAPARRL